MSERTKRGAAFLDEHFGGEWDKRIDIPNLRMNMCNACVLGQVYGDYWDALTVNGLFTEDAIKLGFDVSQDFSLTDEYDEFYDERIDRLYRELRDEWIEELNERRSRSADSARV